MERDEEVIATDEQSDDSVVQMRHMIRRILTAQLSLFNISVSLSLVRQVDALVLVIFSLARWLVGSLAGTTPPCRTPTLVVSDSVQ